MFDFCFFVLLFFYSFSLTLLLNKLLKMTNQIFVKSVVVCGTLRSCRHTFSRLESGSGRDCGQEVVDNKMFCPNVETAVKHERPF